MLPALCFTGFLSGCQSNYSNQWLMPQQYGAVVNDDKDDSAAINTALDTLSPGDILFFPTGVYDLDKPLRRDFLSKNMIIGEPGSILRKTQDFNEEYIFYIRFSKDVSVSGLTFEGLTKDTKQVQWGEQGLYLGSTRNSRVANNTFKDFGDACLRVTTSSSDPVKGINSYNALIEHNRFINCTQVTTTQVADGYGGTKNITVQWNYFDGLKGSLKLCSREPVSGGKVFNNIFVHGKGNAIEICSYSDIEISGNYIADNQKYAMNFYENRPFSWNNHWIHNNVMTDTLAGIGFWGLQTNSNYGPINNIRIDRNCFTNIPDNESLHPGVIRLTSNHPIDSYDGVHVANNRFYNIAANQMIYIRPTAINVVSEENKLSPDSCSTATLANLAESYYWLTNHNSTTYQKRWKHLINRLTDR